MQTWRAVELDPGGVRVGRSFVASERVLEFEGLNLLIRRQASLRGRSEEVADKKTGARGIGMVRHGQTTRFPKWEIW